jgi:hypothetical protein
VTTADYALNGSVCFTNLFVYVLYCLHTNYNDNYSAVPGMYEGRPARYFDNKADMRNHRAVEDASATRNYFATDLLDLNLDADSSSGTLLLHGSVCVLWTACFA